MDKEKCPSTGGIKKKDVKRRSKDGRWEVKTNPTLTLCPSCNVQVPVHLKSQEEHYNSRSHHRKLDVYLLHSFFLKHSLHWVNDGQGYTCLLCHKALVMEASKLLEHVQNCHMLKNLNDMAEENNENTLLVDRSKVWMVDFYTRGETLTTQLNSYAKFTSSSRPVELGPRHQTICDLRTNIFTLEELVMLYKVTDFLEKNGDKVKRSEAKQSTLMCGFGMRRARGDTGWYHYKKVDCLKLSEELANFVSMRLLKNFEKVFDYLNKIKFAEGFKEGEGCIGNSPFTSFTVTRNLDCRPHVDHDDYDLGFVIWLEAGYSEDGKHASFFSFPEVKMSFYPRHGDVLLFSPKSVYHCTRRIQKKNFFGLAFFQKSSLFRQLSKLLHEGETEFIDDDTNEHVIQNCIEFFAQKEIYEEKCFKGRLSLENFK